MMLGATVALSSCNGAETPEVTETADPTEGKVSVVRALIVMEAGTKVERRNFEEVWVDEGSVPADAFATIGDVVNKFLTVKVYPGDMLVPDKVGKLISSDANGSNFSEDHKDYVLVTEYTDGVSGDVSDKIQQAIDENPNKTIYFPDGRYNIAKPIQTSADPAKAVSLKLSAYAVVSAMASDKWTADSSLFELGAKDNNKDMSAVVCFEGGVLNADSKCNGLAIVGGNVLVNNVSFKKGLTGIIIRDGARADVDSCVIAGADGKKSVGVLMEGEESTLTNMRICSIITGVKLTGSNNVLRNIHPLGGTPDMIESTGFWDSSKDGNFYDICYSDQFANSFRLDTGAPSVFSGCFGYWYDGSNGNHYGFLAEAPFNALVINTRISLNSGHKSACDLSYLVAEKEGGTGLVIYPRVPQNDDEHLNEPGHLNDYLATAIMS
jgi:hypothetical protein